MRIDDLRRGVPGEEVDYACVMSALRDYANPRAKVAAWLRRGELIRVKKGLYVFGPGAARRPYSRELLANLIYGPSYISLDSALQLHGLIPERVRAVTSVTCGRPHRFQTPLGLFLYRSAPMAAYAHGIDCWAREDRPPFLIATPEKALADKVRDDRGTALLTLDDMRVYLTENLRIPEERLAGLKVDALRRIAEAYRSRKLRRLADCIARRR